MIKERRLILSNFGSGMKKEQDGFQSIIRRIYQTKKNLFFFKFLTFGILHCLFGIVDEFDSLMILDFCRRIKPAYSLLRCF
jgi:hypothetical protein